MTKFTLLSLLTVVVTVGLSALLGYPFRYSGTKTHGVEDVMKEWQDNNLPSSVLWTARGLLARAWLLGPLRPSPPVDPLQVCGATTQDVHWWSLLVRPLQTRRLLSCLEKEVVEEQNRQEAFVKDLTNVLFVTANVALAAAILLAVIKRRLAGPAEGSVEALSPAPRGDDTKDLTSADTHQCQQEQDLTSSDTHQCQPEQELNSSDTHQCQQEQDLTSSDTPQCQQEQDLTSSDTPQCQQEQDLTSSDTPQCQQGQYFTSSDTPQCQEKEDSPSCEVEEEDAPSSDDEDVVVEEYLPSPAPSSDDEDVVVESEKYLPSPAIQQCEQCDTTNVPQVRELQPESVKADSQPQQVKPELKPENELKPEAEAEKAATTVVTLPVLPDRRHCVTGVEGGNLLKLQRRYPDVTVSVPPPEDRTSTHVRILGPKNKVVAVCEAIADRLAAAEGFERRRRSRNVRVVVEVSPYLRRFVIGRGGEELRWLSQEYPRVTVSVPRRGNTEDHGVTIRGPPDDVAKVQAHIEDLVAEVKKRPDLMAACPQ